MLKWLGAGSWGPSRTPGPHPSPEALVPGTPTRLFIPFGQQVGLRLLGFPHPRPPLLANPRSSVAFQAMPPLPPAAPPKNPPAAATDLQKKAQTPWPGIQGPSWLVPAHPSTRIPKAPLRVNQEEGPRPVVGDGALALKGDSPGSESQLLQ